MGLQGLFGWERRSAQATHKLTDSYVEHDVMAHKVVLEFVMPTVTKRTLQFVADMGAHVGPRRLPVLARLGTQAAQIRFGPRTHLYMAGEVL